MDIIINIGYLLTKLLGNYLFFKVKDTVLSFILDITKEREIYLSNCGHYTNNS